MTVIVMLEKSCNFEEVRWNKYGNEVALMWKYNNSNVEAKCDTVTWVQRRWKERLPVNHPFCDLWERKAINISNVTAMKQRKKTTKEKLSETSWITTVYHKSTSWCPWHLYDKAENCCT